MPTVLLRYSGGPSTKTMEARPVFQSVSFFPSPVHNGGSPCAVRVPGPSTSCPGPESECGPQDHGPQGDTLPFQPTDVIHGPFFSGEGSILCHFKPQEDQLSIGYNVPINRATFLLYFHSFIFGGFCICCCLS